ncbi:hypothetical protein EVU96_08785 [Bacillus infantis]|uniref:hypothetical protein n=1 Tax=Bacillus infantis TaxID=324767 RepID=UPI00101E1322|nr:hypothetical protein [Bacillus infantis]RYI30499.1 hypothetical protein EVU96_08785 [Bacillus infantis]
MKFYVKLKTEHIKDLSIGTEMTITMGEKLIDVTVTDLKDDKVFIETDGEHEEYLKTLFEYKVNSFSME